MKYIELDSHDIFQNLAAEEYILHHFTDDTYLLLYRNDDAIVLGKYQNIYQEINVPAVETAGIRIARRITGGGTVFHDNGNLNYSFIAENDKNRSVSYDDFLFPVIDALRAMGIEAEKRNVCDIAIGDYKISGNAQCVCGNRVLHHGTLLFDTDMKKLHHLLTPTDAVLESKAVASVPSPVTNIREHLADSSMTMEEFQSALLSHIFPSGITRRELTGEDKKQILQLAEEKYCTWEWNCGKSPRFTLHRDNMNLSVEHGIITYCHIPFLSPEASKALSGQRYGYQNLLHVLSSFYGKDTESKVKKLF